MHAFSYINIKYVGSFSIKSLDFTTSIFAWDSFLFILMYTFVHFISIMSDILYKLYYYFNSISSHNLTLKHFMQFFATKNKTKNTGNVQFKKHKEKVQGTHLIYSFDFIYAFLQLLQN